MYHLLHGLYLYVTRKEEYSLLILGLDNAGKTTLLGQIGHLYAGQSGETLHKTVPTVGQNIGHALLDGHILLKFWDVGGQEALRALWSQYFASAHGIVFVVDSTDRPRIEECRDVLSGVMEHHETEGLPVLMLANKQDREDSLEIEDIKEIFNSMAVQLGARDSRVLPVSALQGTGVRDAIDWIKVRLLRNREYRPPLMR